MCSLPLVCRVHPGALHRLLKSDCSLSFNLGLLQRSGGVGGGVMNNDPSAHRGHGHRWRRREVQRFAITTRLSSSSVLRLSHFSFSRKGSRELCVFRCYLLSLLNDPPLHATSSLFVTLLLIYIHCTMHVSLPFLGEFSKARGETRPLGCATASPLPSLFSHFFRRLSLSFCPHPPPDPSHTPLTPQVALGVVPHPAADSVFL